ASRSGLGRSPRITLFPYTTLFRSVRSDDLQALLRAGRYQATTEPAILAESDAVLICVPTPLRKSKDPDITYVIAAAKEAAARFRDRKSTRLNSSHDQTSYAVFCLK